MHVLASVDNVDKLLSVRHANGGDSAAAAAAAADAASWQWLLDAWKDCAAFRRWQTAERRGAALPGD